MWGTKRVTLYSNDTDGLFNNKWLCSHAPSSWAQDTKPRQLAHQERGHCVLLSVIYVVGRGPATLPVIMTLRCDFDGLFIILSSWDGLGC